MLLFSSASFHRPALIPQTHFELLLWRGFSKYGQKSLDIVIYPLLIVSFAPFSIWSQHTLNFVEMKWRLQACSTHQHSTEHRILGNQESHMTLLGGDLGLRKSIFLLADINGNTPRLFEIHENDNSSYSFSKLYFITFIYIVSMIAGDSHWMIVCWFCVLK